MGLRRELIQKGVARNDKIRINAFNMSQWSKWYLSLQPPPPPPPHTSSPVDAYQTTDLHLNGCNATSCLRWSRSSRENEISPYLTGQVMSHPCHQVNSALDESAPKDIIITSHNIYTTTQEVDARHGAENMDAAFLRAERKTAHGKHNILLLQSSKRLLILYYVQC